MVILDPGNPVHNGQISRLYPAYIPLVTRFYIGAATQWIITGSAGKYLRNANIVVYESGSFNFIK